MDYENYVLLCERLGLPYSPGDAVEAANHRIFFAILTRVEAIEAKVEQQENRIKALENLNGSIGT